MTIAAEDRVHRQPAAIARMLIGRAAIGHQATGPKDKAAASARGNATGTISDQTIVHVATGRTARTAREVIGLSAANGRAAIDRTVVIGRAAIDRTAVIAHAAIGRRAIVHKASVHAASARRVVVHRAIGRKASGRGAIGRGAIGPMATDRAARRGAIATAR